MRKHIAPTKLILVLFLAMAQPAYSACELTPEYKVARKEAYAITNEPFSSCNDSVGAWNYWKAYSACISEGKAKDTQGGCAHYAGFRGVTRSDYEHCEILRPTAAQFEQALTAILEARGISERQPSAAQ